MNFDNDFYCQPILAIVWSRCDWCPVGMHFDTNLWGETAVESGLYAHAGLITPAIYLDLYGAVAKNIDQVAKETHFMINTCFCFVLF